MLALDVAYVSYTKAAQLNQPFRAMVASGLIHVFSVVSVVSYTDDLRYVSATLGGTLVGTYAAVWRERRKALAEPTEETE